jgi:hypothetical protein
MTNALNPLVVLGQFDSGDANGLQTVNPPDPQGQDTSAPSAFQLALVQWLALAWPNLYSTGSEQGSVPDGSEAQETPGSKPTLSLVPMQAVSPVLDNNSSGLEHVIRSAQLDLEEISLSPQMLESTLPAPSYGANAISTHSMEFEIPSVIPSATVGLSEEAKTALGYLVLPSDALSEPGNNSAKMPLVPNLSTTELAVAFPRSEQLVPTKPLLSDTYIVRNARAEPIISASSDNLLQVSSVAHPAQLSISIEPCCVTGPAFSAVFADRLLYSSTSKSESNDLSPLSHSASVREHARAAVTPHALPTPVFLQHAVDQVAPQERVAIYHQIARAVHEHIHETHPDKPIRVQIRLEPPELGEVEIQLHYRGRELEAQFRVEQATTQVLLENQRSQLEETLAQFGINVKMLVISFQGQENQNQRHFEEPSYRPIKKLKRQNPAGDTRVPVDGVDHVDVMA